MQFEISSLSFSFRRNIDMSIQVINKEINNELLLDEVFEKVTSAIIVLDKSGIVIRANECAKNMFQKDITNNKWIKVVKECFLPQKGEDHEATLFDGRKILVTTKPLTIGQLVVLTDVTVTCKLQERVSHMERLTSLGKMAASLAHQIRTPLSAAMLYAANLCNRALDMNARELFGKKLVDRLKDLENQVSDVLMFARSGEKIAENVSIQELVENARSNAEGVLARYNAKLDIRMDDVPMNIIANKTALSGAISNLIVNALEAKANHLFMDVSQKNGMVILKIADNGLGMEKEQVNKIFDPFYTTKSHGTGLGLAVVRSVVNAHQGRVGLVSEKNKGSCFSITLPLLTETVVNINNKVA